MQVLTTIGLVAASHVLAFFAGYWINDFSRNRMQEEIREPEEALTSSRADGWPLLRESLQQAEKV